MIDDRIAYTNLFTLIFAGARCCLRTRPGNPARVCPTLHQFPLSLVEMAVARRVCRAVGMVVISIQGMRATCRLSGML